MKTSPSLLVLSLAAWSMGAAHGQAPPAAGANLSRIAFGSCANQDLPQPIWDAVLAQRPELFVFLGDNIYGDTADMEVMRGKYAKLAAIDGYRRLRAACPVIATWDDHDYGANDAGREFAAKEASKEVFLDFFGEPPASPRRSRPGVYTAHAYGPPGRRVQVILLDTRWFRSPLRPRPGRKELETKFLPDDSPRATLLGAAQWRWLEERLREPAQVRIVASSIAVLVDGHRGENWLNFPRERTRLFDLVRRTGAAGVVFISGDSHYAELSSMRPEGGYPLWEVTSSALNLGWKNDGRVLPNRNRVGDYFSEDNFGMIEIDWDAERPSLGLRVHDGAGKAVIEKDIALDELR